MMQFQEKVLPLQPQTRKRTKENGSVAQLD